MARKEGPNDDVIRQLASEPELCDRSTLEDICRTLAQRYDTLLDWYTFQCWTASHPEGETLKDGKHRYRAAALATLKEQE